MDTGAVPPGFRRKLHAVACTRVTRGEVIDVITLVIVATRLPGAIAGFVLSVTLKGFSEIGPYLPVDTDKTILVSTLILGALVAAEVGNTVGDDDEVIEAAVVDTYEALIQILI